MSFNLYSSNKLELLAAELRQMVLKQPLDDAFTPETVVIQSQGMVAYLEQEMARNGSIMANFEMIFLRKFIFNTLTQFLSEKEAEEFDRERKLFSPEVMTWRIFKILGEKLSDESTECWKEVKRYISSDSVPDSNSDSKQDVIRKRLELAGRIADLFDQYQVYRGDMLEKWTRPDGESNERYAWQRDLYQELIKNDPKISGDNPDEKKFVTPFGWFDKFSKFKPDQKPQISLPTRVNVFGVGTMPPLYLNFLGHLSEFTVVNLFYLNPCREFWDVNRQQFRDWLKQKEECGIFENADAVNPLLVSLGAQGRGFFAQTLELPESVCVNSTDLFDTFLPKQSELLDYPGANMLQTIQEDILRMRQRCPEGDNKDIGKKREIDYQNDRSIRVHSCHSIRRELEVLKDELIRLFDESKGAIQPRDVLVMAPDINAYEPYIRMVFDDENFKGRYTISDRSLRQESLIAETFLQLLKIVSGRFEVSEIFSLLEVPPLRQKFRFAEEEMESLRELVELSSIRWGYDADTHKRFCDFKFEEFSWRYGLDRLLLGFAMTAPDNQLVNDKYRPCGNIEGSDAELLGRFASFVESLAKLGLRLNKSYSPSEWAKIFRETLDDFFYPAKESLPEIFALRRAFETLADAARDAACEESLPLEAAADQLSRSLDFTQNNQPFLRGGITFCSMLPLRSIPMPVIALLGLNEGEFPRRDIQYGFSVLSEPKLGDRSRQKEDRYLFLEAILSARRNLLLFYHGRDPLTLEKRNPAMPLAELIDVIKASFHDFDVIQHALQNFDFRYFKELKKNESGSCSSESCESEESKDTSFKWEKEPRSYSGENCKVANSLRKYLSGETEQQPCPSVTLALKASEALEALKNSKNSKELIEQIEPDKSNEPDEQKLPIEIDLEEIEKAFTDHPLYFLRNRAGLSFINDRKVLEDKEPLTLDGLGGYQVRDQLLNWLSSEELPEERAYQLMSADGKLPPGSAGINEFEVIKGQIAALSTENRDLLKGCHRKSISVEIDGFTIKGAMYLSKDDSTQLYLHASDVAPKHRLRLRLRHLLLTLHREEEIALREDKTNEDKTNEDKIKEEKIFSTGIFIKDQVKVIKLPPIEPSFAKAEFKKLLELYLLGLNCPLPLAANLSSACSEKEKPEEKWVAARAKLVKNPFDFKLDNLDAFYYCFGKDNFSDEFRKLMFDCADLVFPKQSKDNGK